MRLFVNILIGLLVLGQPAQSESPLRAMETADQGRGWEGVGRLNLGDTGFCTAAMVTPDVVLTAAHCLFYKHDGTRIPVREIEFQAGLRHGRASAYRGIRRVVLHPSYDFNGHNQLTRVGNDLALLELTQPIQVPGITPYRTQLTIETGQSVQVVSYAKDREDVPSLEPSCSVLTRDADVMVLSCEVDFGASGAPIFMTVGNERRIVSVISAKAEWQNQPVALAAVLEGELAVLVAAFRQTVPVDGLTVGQATGEGTGARFVRP